MNPNSLLFFTDRERQTDRVTEREERESKSSPEGVVGWCDGAG